MIFFRKLTLILLALLLFSTGCAKCKSDSTALPRAADARLSALSETLPADVDAAIIIPEIDPMQSTLKAASQRISHYNPQFDQLEQQIVRRFGLRLSEQDSWKEAGLLADGSLLVGLTSGRPVVITFVEDREKFEAKVIERIRTYGKIDSPIRTETIANRQIRVSGEQAGSDIAWYYDGPIVTLALPPFDAMGVYTDGSAATIVSNIAAADKEASLGKSQAFKDFRKALGDHYPVSIYLNSKRYFEREDKANFGALGPIVEGMASWSKSNADAAGFAARVDGERFEVRAYLGGDDELIKEARAAHDKKVDTDWNGMLTTNTALAIRTSFDLHKAYQTFIEGLPDEERRSFRRQLAQFGRAYELDVEEDVIAAFSGNSLITFYGMGGDMTRLLAAFTADAEPIDIIRTLLANAGLLINLHFTDAAKLDTLLNRFAQFGGDHLERRPLLADGKEIKDVEVFEPKALNLFPARLFRKETSLTLAAAAIGENSVHQYLTSARSEGTLDKSEEFALGKRFAQTENLNGVYLNVKNLRSNLRRIPLISGFAGQLQPFHEALIEGGVDDHGFYASFTVDFTEALSPDGDAH